VDIIEGLKNTKIKHIQLDLFGYCNAACWYCPVKYISQPSRTRKHMPVSLVEKILSGIHQEREKENGIISKSLTTIYSTHYGEILLYKYFEDFLKLLHKYNFTTVLYSNGSTLTPDKVELINRNKEVVSAIVLNVPSFDREIWSKRLGLPVTQYDKFIENLEYADNHLTLAIPTSTNLSESIDGLIMLINGVDDDVWNNATVPGKDFASLQIDTDPLLGERAKAYDFAQSKFKNFFIHKEHILQDRAGLISNVISNQELLEQQLVTGEVIGCTGYAVETDRTTEWVHINPLGEIFLCCNDYNMDYVFGNLTETSLDEIWFSEKHIAMIKQARQEICRSCCYAKIG
jgi:radical SAM protein with 4Fe4S-binding SPASM domain